MESLAVFNALCAGFANAPSMCQATLGSYTPDFLPTDEGIKAGVIVAVVVLLVLVNIVIVYCYRRYAKREMQNEMQMQIESAVSQYFALSQREGGKAFVK
jgi:heme/copper-type cytochrome/quinol oxidase subunit 2